MQNILKKNFSFILPRADVYQLATVYQYNLCKSDYQPDY
jgi:hypothetical protein